jgi:hypothetical protein
MGEQKAGREDLMEVYRDEEQYLAHHGAGRACLGDAGLHKQPGSTPKSRARAVALSQARDALVIARRFELRQEFADRLTRGMIRLMTPKEDLVDTASGHPDNESTQAARRLLKRRFDIDYPDC